MDIKIRSWLVDIQQCISEIFEYSEDELEEDILNAQNYHL